MKGRTGHDLREALPEREAAAKEFGEKDTGAAGAVVRSMSSDGTTATFNCWFPPY